MTVELTPPRKLYTCPNCQAEEMHPVVVRGAHMHPCPGLGGLTAPLVAAGLDVKVEPVERDDYIGNEHGVRFDADGTPVQSIITTHDDGSNDCVVFAPAATASANL